MSRLSSVVGLMAVLGIDLQFNFNVRLSLFLFLHISVLFY
jgi:hypothetical protein